MIRHNVKTMSCIADMWPPDPERITLLFIHGAGSSGLFWEPQVKGLSKYANTVAVDLPGHGYSKKESGKDRIEDYAEVIKEFADNLNLNHIVVCGLSMGGAIVQQLLIDNRNSFKGGVLIGTGARLRVMPEIFTTIESNYPEYIEMLKKVGFSPKTDPETTVRIAEQTAKCNPAVTKNDFSACNEFNVMNKLHVIDVPVLVVTGLDDLLTPPKYGEFLEKNIKKAYKAQIPDAGHLCPAEKPDAFNKAVIDFLNCLNPD
jgi:pimeloyl-ACP methyl ester carboxylesterase